MTDKAPRITGQLAIITMADGTTHEALIQNPDMARWDLTRHAHKWPTMEEAPVVWATFVAWHALRRAGILGPEVKFETFRDDLCLAVDMPQPEGEEVDPTNPGPVPASA